MCVCVWIFDALCDLISASFLSRHSNLNGIHLGRCIRYHQTGRACRFYSSVSFCALISYPRSLDVKATAEQPQEQVVTPWDVQGGVSNDGKQQGIDYEKLVVQFGTRRVDQALLDRFERLTGHKPHIFLRRGMFFSHRYITAPMTETL